MKQQKVIIFSAPSGSGKSTVVNHLLPLFPEMEFSISATSRAPRGEEKDGKEYHFITNAQFESLIKEDGLVEWEQVYAGHYYGTLKSEVERIWDKGHVIVFDVDVKGGVNLKKYFGESALSVLIVPPSMEVLEQRLRGRGTDSEQDIRMRLDKASSELEFADGRFDRKLVNDDLQTAFLDAENMVKEFLKK